MVLNGWRAVSSVEEMNEVIRDNWNVMVGPKDLVILHGDAVMAHREETLPWMGTLNGRINLIPGNHDYIHPMHGNRAKKWMDAYSQYFEEIMPLHKINRTLYGHSVILSHFPYHADHTVEVRYPEWRPVDEGFPLIHGHLHGSSPTSPDRPRQVDVGLDAWGLRPVHVDEVRTLLEPYWVD
jgi:calcineurin-like phosphoesterase family protein